MNRKGLVSFPVLTSFVLGFIILVAMLVTGLVIFTNLGSVRIAGSSVSSSSSENNAITQTFLINNESNFTLSNVSTSVNSVTTLSPLFVKMNNSFPNVQSQIHLINLTGLINTTLLFGEGRNFTISTWIKNDYISNGEFIYGNVPQPLATEKGFALRTANGPIDFLSSNGSVSNVNPDAEDSLLGLWRHILVTYNGSSIRMYDNSTADDGVGNGTSIVVIGGGFANASTPMFFIGGIDPNQLLGGLVNTSGYNGSIDEFRIYNRVLTSKEINDTFDSGRVANASLNSTGLVLWLSFNEDTPSRAIDKSASSFNGTMRNGNANTYQDEGTVTLTLASDYNISGNQFRLENDDWAYSNITIDYNNGTIVTVTNGTGTSAQALAIATNGSLAFGSLASSFIVWFSVLSLVMLIGIIGSAVLIIKKFGTRG